MSDGQMTVEEVVARAADMDVQPSVSDHISRSIKGLHSAAEVHAYLDVLERYPVLRGGEFCWHDSLWREIPQDLWGRFTHRLGSVHAVVLDGGTLVAAGNSRVSAGVTIGTYMAAYISNIEQLAREMPVDILAHPTILWNRLAVFDPEEIWTEPREERLVEALFRAGIAFELSARYPPHERIVRRAFARGVRLSLGSDGHAPSEVANVARPLELARTVGVPDDALYDPRRHSSTTRP